MFKIFKRKISPGWDVLNGSKPSESSLLCIGCWYWMSCLLGCIARKHRVGSSPLIEKDPGPKSHPCSDVMATFCGQKRFCPPITKPTPNPHKPTVGPKWSDLQFKLKKKTKTTRVDLAFIGLPNVGNTCYLNACLQGLMTLERFTVRVRSQEKVWRQSTEAGLLSDLQAIINARCPSGKPSIIKLIHAFKKTVASRAPAFRGHQQNDAHEFLLTLMNQIQSLEPVLQRSAVCIGLRYICPVRESFLFHMDTKRTCTRCGLESHRREMFTILSLDLVPGASIQSLLQHHLKETELEFRCECGYIISRQTTTFASLPNVLVLHLKRFTCVSELWLKKVTCPIHLNRDLVLKAKEDAGCFSLVGIVSHIGDSFEYGHYICDGQDPRDDPSKPTDHWLTYDDSVVSASTGRASRIRRTCTSYILFYERKRQKS